MFIAIVICLMLLTFISYGFISYFLSKEHIESSIHKKVISLGYELISINKIEPPKFLEVKEEYYLFTMSPGFEFYTYKSILMKNLDNKQFEGFVAIRRVIILGTSFK